ncbi:DUF3558 family protein [Amycolatopsis antarctica]|uniref:DUF3558 family protein n=1 Tax=Amycolatopsis antarctica TaxID=1854586 RepID=UPI0013FD835C|nr:DUF3558 family protein [Amycolatopsis antarctica]
MSFSRAAGLAVAVACVAAVSSCADTESGTALPAPTGPQNYAVPDVSTPLDVSSYLEDPCLLVPGGEPGKLGFSRPEPRLPEDDEVARLAGPGCGWMESDNAGTLSVNIQTENVKRGTGGLAGVYQSHFVTGQYVYLDPTDVEGYPAAFADGLDMRERGKTTLYIGVADDLTISVSIGPFGRGKQKQAEDGAASIAAAAVRTLKGGS